jgi:hypothetical protein
MIMRARLLATATLLALAGCNAAPSGEPAGNAAAPDTAAVEQDQASPPPAPDAASTTPVANQPEYEAVPPVAPLPAGPVPAGSCAAEIGAEAATRLATECRAVSPATRPPCNPANSCELIRVEIERGCAMLDEADRPAACAAPAAD